MSSLVVEPELCGSVVVTRKIARWVGATEAADLITAAIDRAKS
jgi:hypothetical protein